MSENWRDDFKRALIDAVILHGSPLNDKDTHWNWLAWEARNHEERWAAVRTVGVDYEKTPMPEDSCWEEFMGTFYEGDTRVYGMDVNLVLNDGTHSPWRYSGTLGALIEAVMKADG